MKKILSFLAIAITALLLTACKETQTGIVWNLKAEAAGNGEVVATFPTGSLTAKGDATVVVRSSTDPLLVDAPVLGAVLAAPQEYDEETVEFAEEVEQKFESAFNVEVLEGEWKVDIVGYAKHPVTGLYILIDQHWPEQNYETAE